MHRWLGICCVWLTACVASGERESALELYRFEAPAMGTLFRCSVFAPDEGQAREAWEAAIARVLELERVASDYDAGSELRRLCERPVGEWTVVSVDLMRLLRRSKEICELTGGAFDPTVGPYVRLWRRARRSGALPEAERIESVASSVGMELVELGEGRVRLLAEGMRLDLGGIAKGDALDEAMRVMRDRGLGRALLDGGGDVLVGAPPPDCSGWVIAVRPLGAEGPAWAVSVHDRAVATSGDASQSVEVDGERYSHIIDPRTGLALSGARAATVIAPSGATADALASALCVMGKDGVALLSLLPRTEACVWGGEFEDDRTCATRGLRWMMVSPPEHEVTSPHVL
jgi:thiamine biosynthesis lipoprotein